MNATFEGQLEDVQQELDEFNRSDIDVHDTGFLIPHILILLNQFYTSVKSNDWELASQSQRALRRLFIENEKLLRLLFSELIETCYTRLNFTSQNLSGMSEFLLGNSDIYVITNHKSIANQSMTIVNLESKKVLFDIFTLLSSSTKPVSKEEIVDRVWQQNYDPTQHDPSIYVNMSRLKKILEVQLGFTDVILNEDSNYFLSSRFSVVEI